MGTRAPQHLDRFSEVERKVIERVRDLGELTIPFKTTNQAYNYKFRLLRYIHALRAYAADEPLTLVANIITIKLRGNILTLTRKDSGDEAQAVLAALAGMVDPNLNADSSLSTQAEGLALARQKDAPENLELAAIGVHRWDESLGQYIPCED